MGSAGEMFSFSKRKEDYTLSESISPVGAGPEPHIQKGYGEFFYLPEGNVKFWVGDKTYPGDSIPGKNASKSDVYSIVTKPGDLLYVPPYTVHGFESLLAPDLITESNSYKFLNKSSFISAALIFGSLSAI
ncbi:cupin domain-containing protein [Pleurocapsa sp. PCC 7319]|uniref:cupin domain-containing protein n=1 Tax=Pleurocapsa sp. PCC 7319 TaxID=118161 RepID=UPI000376706D|nr:cupin domain-containing protein [Pleurocapsa sp. PCC 7319]